MAHITETKLRQLQQEESQLYSPKQPKPQESPFQNQAYQRAIVSFFKPVIDNYRPLSTAPTTSLGYICEQYDAADTNTRKKFDSYLVMIHATCSHLNMQLPSTDDYALGMTCLWQLNDLNTFNGLMAGEAVTIPAFSYDQPQSFSKSSIRLGVQTGPGENDFRTEEKQNTAFSATETGNGVEVKMISRS